VILAYFGPDLVAVATCLRTLESEMSSSDCRPRKLPAISNRIPVVSRRNAFIAILVPELFAMVTSLCPLCTRVSQMNSPIAHVLSQKQTLHVYVAYNWSYGHFCDCLAYFGQNLVAMATSLRALQSNMSSFDWSTTKTPFISNLDLFISVEIHLYAFIAILVPKLVAMVTTLCPLWSGVSQMNSPITQVLSRN